MAIEHVDALDDPRLADYVHLREPSRRMGIERSRGIFTVEGRLSVEALLASSYVTRSLLVTTALADRVARRVPASVPVFALPPRAMEAVTGVHFHRGVLAVGERPAPTSVADVVHGAARVLVLEAVNDHENVGSLFRNAAAFGVDAVVLDPTTADPLYRRATRVSLGHVLRVPFARVDPEGWPGAIDDLRAAGFLTVALTPHGTETVGDVAATRPPRAAVIVGAEGPGLSPASLAAADRRAHIPMAAGVDSVNVATAAAIALSLLAVRPEQMG